MQAVFYGDVVINEDALHGNVLHVQHLSSSFKIEHVSGVVFDQKQHTRATVNRFSSSNHLVRRR